MARVSVSMPLGHTMNSVITISQHSRQVLLGVCNTLSHDDDSVTTQFSYQMIMKKFKQMTKYHPLFIMRMTPVTIHSMMIRMSTLAILMMSFLHCPRVNAIVMNFCAQTCQAIKQIMKQNHLENIL